MEKKTKDVLFSSKKDEWRTPKSFYEKLDEEFKFDHDPCPVNYKIDGLTSEWGSMNFVNPPYGKDIEKWLMKAQAEQRKGATSVFLLPARTDTRWWHKHVEGCEVRFIKGRLCFNESKDKKNRAAFPSVIVIYRGKSWPRLKRKILCQDRNREAVLEIQTTTPRKKR